MYTFDYLEDIRKLEALLYDSPARAEHSFESDRGEFHHFQGRSDRVVLEKIQRKRKELLSDDTAEDIIISFNENFEMIIGNG